MAASRRRVADRASPAPRAEPAATARPRQPQWPQQHQSFVGKTPRHGSRSHARLGDDGLGCQAVLRQNVRRQQAAALTAVRGNAAQQTGNAVGGPERPQNLRIGRAEQTRRGNRHAAGTREQIVAPVGHCLECRLRLGLARIDQPQQIAAIEFAGIERSAQRFGHLVTAMRALDHLAPPLQPDQRQRRLRHHLTRPRQLVIERIERQQRIAPVGRREQRGEEPVGIMPANQRGDRLVHPPKVAPRWHSPPTRASLTRSSTGHS